MKLKLTVAGIQTYQQTMYRLSDEHLKLQSEILLHDPMRWLNQYFLLTKEQLSFLKLMDPEVRKRTIADLSFAIENRHTIEIQLVQNETFKNFEMKYESNGKLVIYLNKPSGKMSFISNKMLRIETTSNFSNKAIK